MKDLDLEEMKERLNNQEKERQSELPQLQLEVSECLRRVPSGFCQTCQRHEVPPHHHEQRLHFCQNEMRFKHWRHLLFIKLELHSVMTLMVLSV